MGDGVDACVLRDRGAHDDLDELTEWVREIDGVSTITATEDRSTWLSTPARLHVLRTGAALAYRLGERTIPYLCESEFVVRADATGAERTTHADCRERWPDHELEALRNLRVFGIGTDAAYTFGALGLEVRREACASSTSPFIVPESETGAGQPFMAFDAGEFASLDDDDASFAMCDENFALHLPPGGDLDSYVQAYARWSGGPDYAPVARQGNYLLSGLATSVPTWTPRYRDFLSGVAAGFMNRPLEPFSVADWALATAGEYSFDLPWPGTDDHAVHRRTLRFRFERPVRLSARLEQQGSNSVMLLFHARRCLHGNRREDSTGEPVTISVDVSEHDIAVNGPEIWLLCIADFARAPRCRCRLVVSIEPMPARGDTEPDTARGDTTARYGARNEPNGSPWTSALERT